MAMQIQNGWVYMEDCHFHKVNLNVEGERILSFTEEKEEKDTILDAEGMYVIPGLTDLHFHGCHGLDFSDGSVETIQKIVEYQRMHGITSVCPAAMTLPIRKLEAIADAVKAYQTKQDGGLQGIHLEGPFINPVKCGAQKESNCLAPKSSLVRQLNARSGKAVRIVTIAPELAGSTEFIRTIPNEMVISIGHSTADYKTAKRAFEMGARQVTHMYNGMNPWNHREPGIPGAALDNKNVMVELICDGFHLHPATVRSAFLQYGAERIVLISDSTMAAGMPDGVYTLGEEPVISRKRCVTTESGTLAGSASNLLECMQTAVLKMGLPLEKIVRCAAMNPAKILKTDANYGSLSIGKYANIILLNQKLEPKNILYRGKKVK